MQEGWPVSNTQVCLPCARSTILWMQAAPFMALASHHWCNSKARSCWASRALCGRGSGAVRDTLLLCVMRPPHAAAVLCFVARGYVIQACHHAFFRVVAVCRQT